MQLDLNPEYGREAEWEFMGYRQRQMFNYAGKDQGYITKNTMCMKQLQPGVPKTQVQSACCTFKTAPEMEEPNTSACDDPKETGDLVCLGLKDSFASATKALLEQVKVM